MADSNLAEAAKLFAIKMNLGAYQEAAKIKSDFGLPNDMLIEAVRLAYDANMKKGDYSLAADLAKKYDLPEDLRLEAAERSFNRKIDSEFYRAAADYAREFGLSPGSGQTGCGSGL